MCPRAFATDRARFESSLRLFLGVNAVLAVGMTVTLAASAQWLAKTVYGSDFADSGGVLAILALVLGLRCVTFALAAAIVGAGLQTRRIWAQAVSALLSIVVNLVVVQRWGIEGVAWVYVLTEFVLMLGYWRVLAPLKLDLRPQFKRV